MCSETVAVCRENHMERCVDRMQSFRVLKQAVPIVITEL
jgi:hypothetical protein